MSTGSLLIWEFCSIDGNHPVLSLTS